MERKSGVLMHISSLFGDYSIGSFGDAANYFIDFLSDCGFTYWQILPFCPTDEYNSPYKSPSSFAGNPYFIDLETLYKNGLLSADALESQKQHTPYTCEYTRLSKERISFLNLACERSTETDEIHEFIEKNSHLKHYCKFMAIKTYHGGSPWYTWKNETYHERDFFLWEFMQYTFFTQWESIKQYANSKGIKIIGDMPLYVHLDSSDVWANRHLFKLDKNNFPITVAGVPPDYFCEDGQLWGNPIYDWETMEKEDFLWWRERVSHMTKLFDGIRIDHFRGIESFWEIPGNATNARKGTMTKGPCMKLIHCIREECGKALVIAEDLGIVTKEVSALLKESGFPGMRVFQFSSATDAYSPHSPHNYTNHCIAYSGTHDNNTLLGYLEEQDEKNRNQILSYCSHGSADWKKGCASILRTLLASHAGIVIFPIQDIIGLGTNARMNTPGKAEGNWAFRITKAQLDNIDKMQYRRWNEIYGRI